jgi:hypothetical protein
MRTVVVARGRESCRNTVFFLHFLLTSFSAFAHVFLDGFWALGPFQAWLKERLGILAISSYSHHLFSFGGRISSFHGRAKKMTFF